MQNHQRAPVRYFVKSDQIPSRTGAKLSFKGIMFMADEAEMWLILLIPTDPVTAAWFGDLPNTYLAIAACTVSPSGVGVVPCQNLQSVDI